MKDNKKSLAKNLKKNPWMVSTVVLALVLVAFGAVTLFSGQTSSAKTAGMSFVDFINSQGAAEVEFISAEDFSEDLYQVTVVAEGQELPVHITKDGKYWVQLYADLDPSSTAPVEGSDEIATGSETPEVVKADTPTVELFVMTHCPYGTQAEKGFIPAMKALDGIADLKVRFVHYFMHTNEQEEVETPRQVCIREEQPEKYIPYLECFLDSSAGTPEEALACQEEVGVDAAALTECISSGRAEAYYEEDAELSEAYGVQGSPTLVVNGEIVQAGRSSQAYGDVTCSAFNEVPEACGELSLDSASPSPGFGYSAGTSGSATTAQC